MAWGGIVSSSAYGAALERLEAAERDGGVTYQGQIDALTGIGRAVLAVVDEVEPLVDLLRELVEQHRVVDAPGFVDGPRLDGDVPFVEDPDPLQHDHGGRCTQCAVPGGTCCPHCSGARIGTARGSIGGRT